MCSMFITVIRLLAISSEKILSHRQTVTYLYISTIICIGVEGAPLIKLGLNFFTILCWNCFMQ